MREVYLKMKADRERQAEHAAELGRDEEPRPSKVIKLELTPEQHAAWLKFNAGESKPGFGKPTAAEREEAVRQAVEDSMKNLYGAKVSPGSHKTGPEAHTEGASKSFSLTAGLTSSADDIFSLISKLAKEHAKGLAYQQGDEEIVGYIQDHLEKNVREKLKTLELSLREE